MTLQQHSPMIVKHHIEFNNQTDWLKINVDDIGKELHFFDTIANNLFPDFTQDRIEEANKNLIKQLRVKIEEGND